jgi:hypothetical protein
MEGGCDTEKDYERSQYTTEPAVCTLGSIAGQSLSLENFLHKHLEVDCIDGLGLLLTMSK